MGKGRRLFLHGRPNVAGDLNFFCLTLWSLQTVFFEEAGSEWKVEICITPPRIPSYVRAGCPAGSDRNYLVSWIISPT